MKILKKIKIDMWINAIMTLIIGILFIARPQGAMLLVLLFLQTDL